MEKTTMALLMMNDDEEEEEVPTEPHGDGTAKSALVLTVQTFG